MTEIAKYNGMMSYLTRPPAPKTQVADLVDDLEPGPLKDELLKDFDPTQEEYEEYLQRKGLGERPFNASEGGSPLVPKPKPYTLEQFQEKADLYIKGALGGFPKDEMINKLQLELDKAEESGILSREEAINFLNERTQQIKEFIQNNPGEADLSRVKKAIGGGVIEGEDLGTREGFAGIKQVKNVKKFENKFPNVKLGDYYYEIRNPNYLGVGKGDSPRITIGPFKSKKAAKASYDARQKKVEKIKATNLKETKTLYDAQTRKINKFVTDFYNDNINKYGLRDYDLFEKDLFEAFKNSGIGDAKKRKAIAIGYPNVGKFSSAGVKGSKFPLTLFGIKARMASGFKVESDAAAFFKKAFYSAQLAKKPKLVENLKKYLEYYNTDKKYYGLQNEVNRAALQKQYADVLDPRVKSDLLFLLESDDIGTGNLRRGFLRVYIPEQYDAYVAKKGQASLRYKRLVNEIENSLTNNQLKRALNGATSIKSFMTNQTNLLNKIFDTSALKKAGYGELIFNADHLEGIAEIARMDNAEDKIRGLRNIVGTTAARNYELGMQGFSVQRKGLMNKIKNGINIEPSVKKLNEITKIAYPEFEGNLYKYNPATKSAVPTRNFIVDYDPETAFRQYFRDLIKSPVGLKELKKQYTNNPELQKVIQKDKSLASQLDKTYKVQYYANKAGKLGLVAGLTVPFALGIKKEISEGRNPFSMSVQAAETEQLPEGSPGQINQEDKSFIEEYPLLTGAAGVAGTGGALAASKLTKPTSEFFKKPRRFVKELAKMPLRAIGSVPAATYFAGKELMSEDPSYAIAGADLLLPELGKRVKGSGTGIMSRIGRFALNPIGRLARGFTPAGIALQGVELVNQAMKEQKRIEDMRENDPEAYQEYLAEQEDMMRESAAYGGRMGFADGPKDPSRRNFMKILGGLASLPIVGRFFDVAKETPVVKNIFTEITKLKDTKTLMPDWFPAFVDKFRKEGKAENMFKKKKVAVTEQEYNQALAEGKGQDYFVDPRTPEYIAKNPDHSLYNKLVETDELIGTTYTNEKFPGVDIDDFDGEIQVNWENDYSQPVNIVYVKPGGTGPDVGRPDKFQAGIEKQEFKPKGEFSAMDQEVYATDPDGGYDTNAVIVDSLYDMMEGTTREMEEYATGKKVKKLSRGEGKVIEAEVRANQMAEQADELDQADYEGDPINLMDDRDYGDAGFDD